MSEAEEKDAENEVDQTYQTIKSIRTRGRRRQKPHWVESIVEESFYNGDLKEEDWNWKNK